MNYLDQASITARVEYFKDGKTHNHDAEYFMQYLYCMLIRHGDVVVDVGANKGLHTIPMAHLVGQTGRVYAFEAIPENASLVSNRSVGLNVSVIQAACTNYSIRNTQSSVKFCHVRKLDGFSGIRKRPNVIDEWDPVELVVPTITLDEAIPLDSRVTFIKSDVECGDFHVLQGAERILAKSRPIVIFESGRQYAADLYNYTKDDFFDYFSNLNYKLYTFTGEIFDDSTWTNPVNFWETWAVPVESSYTSFFKENLMKLAAMYSSRMQEMQKFYVTHHKSD
jgi:FkbM family methyltransferase